MALQGRYARQSFEELAGQEVEPSRPAPRQRQKQTRLSAERVDELVATYLAGVPLPQLAAQFDVNESTVLAHLRRQEAPRRPFRKLHGEQLARAVELYAAGLSLRSVAAELGMSKGAVRAGLVAGGVELRSR